MANPIVATRNYFMQSAAELKKVAWPSRDMTMRYSILVVAVSLILAVFFAGLDYGLQTAVNAGLAARTANMAPAPAAAPPVTPDTEPTVQVSGDQNGQTVNVQSDQTPTTQTPKDNNGNITLPPIETPKN